MNRNVDVLVGLQWGSEAKGKFAQAIADRYDVAVRVGGPNAGHTVYVKNDKGLVRVVNRSIPCAWVNRRANLIIGPGATIDVQTLENELRAVAIHDPAIYRRLTIDRRATIITQDDVDWERQNLSHMGSTAHGIGRSYVRKIERRGMGLISEFHGNLLKLSGGDVEIADTVDWLHSLDSKVRILVEGTQGALLSIDHGDWPFVTSRNPLAGALAAEAGFGPTQIHHVLGVMRTYPIRVGGPSGPMYHETTWDRLSTLLGRKVEPETTTVTGRKRRIALLDATLLRKAIQLNGVTNLFVSFLDYVDPDLADVGRNGPAFTGIEAFRSVSPKVRAFIEGIESDTGLRVAGVSWGPLPSQGVVNW